jgi:hypothetical protein
MNRNNQREDIGLAVEVFRTAAKKQNGDGKHGDEGNL